MKSTWWRAEGRFLEGIVSEFVFLIIEARKAKGHRVVASVRETRRALARNFESQPRHFDSTSIIKRGIEKPLSIDVDLEYKREIDG